VSNSQLLVFYSSQIRITISGNVTNWNDTGFDENYETPSKFRVKILQTMSRCHQDKVTINGHISFYTNARFCEIVRHFVNFIGSLSEFE